ncbi:hypothetical protein CR513_53124, partial [Mucuna pruriens]
MDTKVQYIAKNWITIQIKTPSLQSLRQSARELKGPWRRVLKERSSGDRRATRCVDGLGIILRLTFKLAPTLEEYERILGMLVVELSVYFYRGYYPLWASIARLIKGSKLEVTEMKRSRNGMEGQ